MSMKSLRVFVLEDEIDRIPRIQILQVLQKSGHTPTIAMSAPEAMRIYKPGAYDLLLLDHDMEGFYEKSTHPNTGFQFVKWLVDVELARPEVVLHSQNFDGRRNMASLLTQHDFKVNEFPFSLRYVQALKNLGKDVLDVQG